MYLIVRMSDDTIKDLIDAVDSCHFVADLASAKKMASSLKGVDRYEYEVINLQTEWTTGKKNEREHHI